MCVSHSSPFQMRVFIVVTLSLFHHCILSMWRAYGFSFYSYSSGSRRAAWSPDIETISHYLRSKGKEQTTVSDSDCLFWKGVKCIQHVGKGEYWIVEYQKGGIQLWEFVYGHLIFLFPSLWTSPCGKIICTSCSEVRSGFG